MAEQPPSSHLFDLYKIAIEEYRFEVKLGWDRTMYYFVFNSAIISVGTGLLKIDGAPITHAFVAAIFLLGLCTSVIGLSATRRGHRYYRRTIIKKTLLEDLLGLTAPVPGYPLQHTLAIGTTEGQTESGRILHETDKWLSRHPRRGSMTFYFSVLFLLLGLIDLGGITASVWMYGHPTEKAAAPLSNPQPVPGSKPPTPKP